ncbi:MAG: NADH-quinone oxidoreductase subunit J [Candidatus Bathyarchaeia archaeon]|jgi:NADH-quinone oxidoreductase subunit J
MDLVPPDLIFVILAAVTIIGSILALQAKELIYGAVALAISFIGIAGFFVFLDAPYLAMLQIAIYVGAVVVLILFTIMLVRRGSLDEMTDRGEGGEGTVGLWLAGLLAIGIAGVAALVGPNLPAEPQPADLPVSSLGPVLATLYPVPLIILALLLSSALLGALILAKVDR